MKLVYRGIKYKSNNSEALKIVQENKHKLSRLIDSKKFYKATITYKFPLYAYLKQMFRRDSKFVRNPHVFWYKFLAIYLENCWKSSEINILESCWKSTVEQEQKNKPESNIAIATDARQKYKYRGVTYYK